MEGDLDLSPFSRDAWSFNATGGTEVTLDVEKLTEGHPYLLLTCISRTTRRRDCIGAEIRNNGESTTRLTFGGRFYVVVSGLRLLGQKADAYAYRVRLRGNPATGPLTLALDNATDETVTQ